MLRGGRMWRPWSSVPFMFSGEDEEDLCVRDTLTHPARGLPPPLHTPLGGLAAGWSSIAHCQSRVASLLRGRTDVEALVVCSVHVLRRR